MNTKSQKKKCELQNFSKMEAKIAQSQRLRSNLLSFFWVTNLLAFKCKQNPLRQTVLKIK